MILVKVISEIYLDFWIQTYDSKANKKICTANLISENWEIWPSKKRIQPHPTCPFSCDTLCATNLQETEENLQLQRTCSLKIEDSKCCKSQVSILQLIPIGYTSSTTVLQKRLLFICSCCNIIFALRWQFFSAHVTFEEVCSSWYMTVFSSQYPHFGCSDVCYQRNAGLMFLAWFLPCIKKVLKV